jgi:hypothetical protein
MMASDSFSRPISRRARASSMREAISSWLMIFWKKWSIGFLVAVRPGYAFLRSNSRTNFLLCDGALKGLTTEGTEITEGKVFMKF